MRGVATYAVLIFAVVVLGPVGVMITADLPTAWREAHHPFDKYLAVLLTIIAPLMVALAAFLAWLVVASLVIGEAPS